MWGKIIWFRYKDIPSDDALRQRDDTVKVIVTVTDKNDNIANFAAQINNQPLINGRL